VCVCVVDRGADAHQSNQLNPPSQSPLRSNSCPPTPDTHRHREGAVKRLANKVHTLWTELIFIIAFFFVVMFLGVNGPLL